MIAATVTATMVARKVDGYSIYTARLRARSDTGGIQRTGGPPGPLAAGSEMPVTEKWRSRRDGC
jgi:hypothetical protein